LRVSIEDQLWLAADKIRQFAVNDLARVI